MCSLDKALIVWRACPMEGEKSLSIRNIPKFSPVESNENIHRLQAAFYPFGFETFVRGHVNTSFCSLFCSSLMTVFQ